MSVATQICHFILRKSYLKCQLTRNASLVVVGTYTYGRDVAIHTQSFIFVKSYNNFHQEAIKTPEPANYRLVCLLVSLRREYPV